MKKRAIMQSIHPYFCMLIANEDKIIEIRKTVPKMELPFKVYIYCTKGKACKWSGKVMGEYICDTYLIDHTLGHDPMYRAAACITETEAAAYCTGVTFGWHISDLKLYDTPKELSEFELKRPPQSWQYIYESEVG